MASPQDTKVKSLFDMVRNDLTAAERSFGEISNKHFDKVIVKHYREDTLRLLDEAQAGIAHLKVIVGK